MSKQLVNMRGSLFRNDKTKPSQPDYHGKAQVNGQHFWMAGWVEGEKDKKYLAISFTPMEEQVDMFDVSTTSETESCQDPATN